MKFHSNASHPVFLRPEIVGLECPHSTSIQGAPPVETPGALVPTTRALGG